MADQSTRDMFQHVLNIIEGVSLDYLIVEKRK